MIIRMFDTAIDAEDIERAKELFRTIIQPAFTAFDGCSGIDMFMGLDNRAGELVEVAAISRWNDRASIDAATASGEYAEALSDFKKLFQNAPIVRHFEEVD